MEDTNYQVTEGCREFERQLSAYVEGENRPFATAHARECPSCRIIVEDLIALRSAAREIPQEEPSPAVWSNIRAQLAAAGTFAEKESAWNRFVHLDFLGRPVPVVGLACLFVLGCFVTVPKTYLERQTTSGIEALPGGTAVRSMALIGDTGALEHVVRELEETFKAHEASLPPDLKATYENSLNSLDVSIRECSDSLQQEPGNSLAHEYLLAAYSEKAEVLSSAVEFDEGR
jgi:hypothetical protein